VTRAVNVAGVVDVGSTNSARDDSIRCDSQTKMTGTDYPACIRRHRGPVPISVSRLVAEDPLPLTALWAEPKNWAGSVNSYVGLRTGDARPSKQPGHSSGDDRLDAVVPRDLTPRFFDDPQTFTPPVRLRVCGRVLRAGWSRLTSRRVHGRRPGMGSTRANLPPNC
jgi:hypothetical protein